MECILLSPDSLAYIVLGTVLDKSLQESYGQGRENS